MRTIKVIFALILAVSMLSAVCFAEGTADAATAALEAMVGVTAAEADEKYDEIKKGSHGDTVKAVQAKLIELGYLTGTADGAYGAMTQEAVKAAQADFGMEQTGTATNEFQQKLYSTTAAN